MLKQISQFVLLVFLVFFAVIQLGFLVKYYFFVKTVDTETVSTVSSGEDNIVLTSAENRDTALAVDKARAAVVYITGKKAADSTLPSSSNSLISFAEPASNPGDKMGSGIIIDSRGYIMTNYHVVSRITDLQASLYGFEGKTWPCTVVSTHPEVDLAVIRISTGFPLPTASLGNSDMVEITDEVMAVGCPFSLEQSVTRGIISDTRRTVDIDGRRYLDLLQTDAVINSGNSGGALINMAGDVIGINVAIYAPSRVYCGVGFAIPINRAKLILMKVQYLQGDGV